MIITTDLNIVRLVELRLLFPPQIHKLCHGCAQFLHVPCDFLARKVSLLNKTQAEGLGTTEGLLFGINFSLNKQTNKTKTLRAQTHKKRKQTNKHKIHWRLTREKRTTIPGSMQQDFGRLKTNLIPKQQQ